MSTTTRNEDAHLEEGLLRNMEEEKVNLLHEHRNETTNEGQLPLDKPRRNGPSLCTLMALTCLGFIAGVTVFASPTMMCRHSHPAQSTDQLVANNNLAPAEKIYIQIVEEHADMGYDEQFRTFEKRAQAPAANGILNRSVAGTGGNPEAGGTPSGQNPGQPGVPGNPGAERTTEVTTQTTTSTSYTTITPGSPSSSPPVISSSHPPISVIPSSSTPHSSAPISSSSPIISSSSIPSSSSTPTSSSTSSSTSIPSTSSSSSLPPPVSSTSSPIPSSSQETESVITSGDITTSLPFTYTRTTVLDGIRTVVITQTTWIPVKPSVPPPKDPNLQNGAPTSNANGFLAIVAGALALILA